MFWKRKKTNANKSLVAMSLTVILLSCANPGYAKDNIADHDFFLKTNSNNVVQKLYDIGSGSVYEYCREGDVYACIRYEKAYSGLLSLCGGGNELACHSYAILESLYNSCLISILR